ncbi:MAG: tetratricopeptide repeat protein [Anaerolineaceae bacterium]|nr:tetratricopeptide repeat protein [Anaerolineaceae bacterium]
MARVPEAIQAYHETEHRLGSLPDGLNTQRIWLQWAKAWAYLLSEINGDHESARKVFSDIRKRINLSDSESDADRLVILSGETNVALNLGRYKEAKEISTEWLAVARSLKNHREEAVVWNARGICSHSLGDLAEASQCYEQAVKLGRLIGHRRIEVIGLYNLSLIYFDQSNLEKAEQCVNEYLSISRLTGNHLAECYGPYVLGNIALQRGEYDKADGLIEGTLQIAQEKGWPRLAEIGQQFQDLLKIQRGLSINTPDDIQTGVKGLAEQAQVSEGFDGETYAVWAIGLAYLDERQAALQIIQNGRNKIADGNPQDEQWLNLAESRCLGDSVQPAVDWFERHGFVRVVQFARKLP